MKARALVAWNVRRIRVDRGISQEKLAYKAGIDRSYMGSLERLSENPTIDLLDRIAETLGAHLSEFFIRPPKALGFPRPYLKVASRRIDVAGKVYCATEKSDAERPRLRLVGRALQRPAVRIAPRWAWLGSLICLR